MKPKRIWSGNNAKHFKCLIPNFMYETIEVQKLKFHAEGHIARSCTQLLCYPVFHAK